MAKVQVPIFRDFYFFASCGVSSRVMGTPVGTLVILVVEGGNNWGKSSKSKKIGHFFVL